MRAVTGRHARAAAFDAMDVRLACALRADLQALDEDCSRVAVRVVLEGVEDNVLDGATGSARFGRHGGIGMGLVGGVKGVKEGRVGLLHLLLPRA
jgi:hypothetical protein